MPTASKKLLLPGIPLVFAVLGGVVMWSGFHGPEQAEEGENAAPVRQRQDSRQGRSPAQDSLSEARAALGESERPAADTLQSLREELTTLPADEAIGRIRDFLVTGSDAETGLDFAVAGGGALSGWPTLRVFLLDLASEIDPAAAAEIADRILQSSTSADEWAVALRNVSRADEAGKQREFLRRKTVELIENADWQAEPSIGYLNAFDVLVAIDATEETPLLSGLVRNKERQDLAHAAFLTLDRLVERNPAEMLPKLATDQALAASRPEMLAQQMARADLRDAAQRETLKAWLLAPERKPVELRAFAGTFPNGNRLLSNNLLSSHQAPSPAELLEHDRQALQVVTDWSQDPQFDRLEPWLGKMQRRLQQFATPASSKPLAEPLARP